jgi:hypothetical protein
LKDSNANLKMKIVKVFGVGSLTHNTSGVERCAGALRQGLKRMTSGSIIHTDLHNPNNKLVSAWLKPFWCTNEPQAYINSQDSLWPELGGSHHLPPYNILYD